DYRRELWSTLLTGGAAGVLREEFLRHAAEVAVSRADPDSEIPAALAVTLNVSSTIEVLTWWLRQKRPRPIEEVARIHERLVILPILEAADSNKRKASGQRRQPRSRGSTLK